MAQGRALASNMAAVAGGKIAAAVAGLLTIMVLTRHLGPHDFGYYRTILTYSAFAAVLADLGIYFVGLREMSRPDADVSRVLGNAFLLRIVTTAGVLLVTSACGLLLPYDPIVKTGFFLGALLYVGYQGNEFLSGVFQRKAKQGGAAIAEAAGGAATLVAVLLLARLDAGVLAMLCGTLFGALVAFAIAFVRARQLIPFRPRFEWTLWRGFLTAALPIAGSQILTMAMLRGDTLLLSLFKNATHVGLYGVPTKMFELATSLPYMFAGLMMPALTAAAAVYKERSGDFTRILGRSLDAMLMYGVGTILALGIFSTEILTLIAGPDFAAGAPALTILAFATTLTALTFVVRFALIAMDRARSVLYVDAVACAIALIAYFVLIPRYSYIGAALGTTLGEGAILVAMFWSMHRAGLTLPRCPSAMKTLLAGAMAAIGIMSLARFDAPWMLSLFVGGAVYIGLLVLLGAIPRELVESLLRRPSVLKASTALQPSADAPAPNTNTRRRLGDARIAIINQPQDPVVAGDDQRGSVAIVNWELAKRLARHYDVVVYAPRGKGQPRMEHWNGIEIRRVRFVYTRIHKLIQLLTGQLRSRRPYFDSPLYYREYFTAIAADLHLTPADVVHLPQQVQFASLFRAATPLAKIVLHMHQNELGLLDEHPLRERLEHVDGIVTVSDWVSRLAAKRFPELATRIHTIGNGVDLDRFCPGTTPVPAEPIRLLFVGRISPEKGVHILMQAFDRLVKVRPDVRLDLAGKPGMLPLDLLGLLLKKDAQLTDLCDFYGRTRFAGLLAAFRGPHAYIDSLGAGLSPGTAERITFHGALGFSKLRVLYQQAHLLVLPSICNESYGMPVAEAMACGVPVIASDGGGVLELIEPGKSGRLVPRADVDSLFETLCALINDRETFSGMRLAARQRAERLTWEHSAERLAHVYDALLEERSSALNMRRQEDATPACG